ncbi:hypothetical protein [Xanthomonas fragariae]|uniref:hypothetical protein n=1 Tax=Xanthomonas fragariae TaxID=48664 RepID=UPI000D55F6AC|nr:hypothetical protein [Xanthomonas fragariae]WIY74152.1 hypothetical protein OW158_18680 [Xanthomonas fragariae]
MPDTLQICDSRLTCSNWLLDKRDATTSLATTLMLLPEVNATRNESRMQNSKNATTTDSSVSRARLAAEQLRLYQ